MEVGGGTTVQDISGTCAMPGCQEPESPTPSNGTWSGLTKQTSEKWHSTFPRITFMILHLLGPWAEVRNLGIPEDIQLGDTQGVSQYGSKMVVSPVLFNHPNFGCHFEQCNVGRPILTDGQLNLVLIPQGIGSQGVSHKGISNTKMELLPAVVLQSCYYKSGIQ